MFEAQKIELRLQYFEKIEGFEQARNQKKQQNQVKAAAYYRLLAPLTDSELLEPPELLPDLLLELLW